MSKRKVTSVAEAPESDDRLVEAVETLTQEVRVLRNVLDQIREEVSWVTRNGIPVQPIEHVVVKQMTLDPCAKDWGERLVVERHVSSAGSLLDSNVLEQFAINLKETFEAIAQGQLEVVLTALDGVRGQLLAAIKRPKQEVAAPISTSSDADVPLPVSTPTAPTEKPLKGHLF